MKYYETDSYTKHGCNIRGKLVVVEYSEDFFAKQDSLPGGGFGRGLCFDFADQAVAWVKENISPDAEVVLKIPDVVCRI